MMFRLLVVLMVRMLIFHMFILLLMMMMVMFLLRLLMCRCHMMVFLFRDRRVFDPLNYRVESMVRIGRVLDQPRATISIQHGIGTLHHITIAFLPVRLVVSAYFEL
uniref:Uncharacterized protein n=1 Tax=Anopheles melas TaxID=34690 RepID=A0A182TKX2_9DIPT